MPGDPAWRGRSDILGWFAAMRWLMIGFLVSLGALLLAAAGLARHIWLQRAALDKGVASPDSSLELDVEPDAEPESGRKHEDE
jgi:hypothetical protein